MNKASGGNGIPNELFQILKDDAVEVLHSICQPIWKRLEKVSFHSNPKDRQCQRMFKLAHSCTHLTRGIAGLVTININILGISECTWAGMGEFNSGDLLLWARIPLKKWSNPHNQQNSLKCST